MLQFWGDYLANPDGNIYHGKPQGARAYREGFIYAMIMKYATIDTGWSFSTEARIHDDVLRRASAKGDWYDENTLAEAFFETREGKKILAEHPDELDKWREGGEYHDQVDDLLAPWTYNATPLVLKDKVPIKEGGFEYNKTGMIYQFVSPFDYDFRDAMSYRLSDRGGFSIEPYICAAPVAVSDIGRYYPTVIRGSQPAIVRNVHGTDYPMSELVGASAGINYGDITAPGGFRIPDISDRTKRWNMIVKPSFPKRSDGVYSTMSDFYAYNVKNKSIMTTSSLYGQLRSLSKYVPAAEWSKIAPRMRSYVSKNYSDLERMQSLAFTEQVCAYLKDQNLDFVLKQL